MQLPPVLRDLYLDRHPFIVVQKGAQVGVSEWMLNQVLWAADTLLGGRGNALYVMPTEAVMRDFVQARVDSAIAASAHLSARVHPELPVRAVDRTGLKRFGEAHAYFRGSDRGQLITVDADIVLLDEFDRMDPETLALAQQRIASSRLGWLRAASTPSAPETGINRLFLESDQRHYLLPCPGCGLEQALTLDNLDAERVLLACSSCGSELDLWAEGRWEAAAPSNGAVHGYHLPRLYSPWANLEQIVHGAESHSLVEEQQFQNQVMGYLPVHGFLGHLIGAACRCRGGVHDGLNTGDEWSERAAGGARSLLVATQGRGGAEAAARRGARRALARARGDRSDAGAVA